MKTIICCNITLIQSYVVLDLISEMAEEENSIFSGNISHKTFMIDLFVLSFVCAK